MAKRDETPLLEWSVGALGAALFVAILVVLISHAATGADAPPDVRTRVERIAPVTDGYLVMFVALNEGDVTAASLRMIATLETPSGAREQHEVTLDYLPPHSERRAGFVFAEDPRAGTLTIAADGFTDP